MSSESMPVLSSAVGIFEVFMSEWEELAESCPKLSPLINVGLKWARKYYSLMDNTDVYIVTVRNLLLVPSGGARGLKAT
jgi:hypothetical protein